MAPSFKIYQSEQGVRMENAQQKAEIAALKRDNNRLRAMVGEPVLVEALAKQIGSNGETFTVGNCEIQIKGPSEAVAAPVLNPMIARARGKVQNVPTDLPASTQPRDLEQSAPLQQQRLNGPQSGVDSDDAALRFSLIER